MIILTFIFLILTNRCVFSEIYTVYTYIHLPALNRCIPSLQTMWAIGQPVPIRLVGKPSAIISLFTVLVVVVLVSNLCATSHIA